MNYVAGLGAVIGGGYMNAALGRSATVVGGEADTVQNIQATVGGGHENRATGSHSAVSGGWGNRATNEYSAILGGQGNTASGRYSVVLGGAGNTTNGNYTLVFGENVVPSVNENYRVYFFGPGGNSPSGFLVLNRLDGAYPIHVGTDGTNGNAAYLSAGGTWTSASSCTFKERFVRYTPAEVLEKLRLLPVEGYFYRGTEEYHITPMAEDFYKLFGTGVRAFPDDGRPNPDVDKYLSANDVAGVAILGVQALEEQLRALQARNQALKAKNAQLRCLLEEAKIRLAQLEAQRAQASD